MLLKTELNYLLCPYCFVVAFINLAIIYYHIPNVNYTIGKSHIKRVRLTYVGFTGEVVETGHTGFHHVHGETECSECTH